MCTCGNCPECISCQQVLIGIAFLRVVDFPHSTYVFHPAHTVCVLSIPDVDLVDILTVRPRKTSCHI